MSTVIAIKDKKQPTQIFADTQATMQSGFAEHCRHLELKRWRNGILVGYAGDLKVFQGINNIYSEEKLMPNMEFYTFINTHLHKTVDDIINKNAGVKFGDMIFVWNDKIWCVDCDFTITEHQDDFTAIGTGGHYALSALAAVDEIEKDFGLNISVFNRYMIAFRIASKYDCDTNEEIENTGDDILRNCFLSH